MPASQRAIAAIVTVLAIAIVAVLLLGGADGPIGRGPDTTPTPTPSVSVSPSVPGSESPTSSDEPSPAASGEDEIHAVLAEIEQQVVEIRGLPAADIGPAELISRDDLEAELQELFEAEYPPEDRERDNFTLRAFGLLGPDDDIGQLQLALLTEQVVGFYDDDEQRMVVVSDTGLDANAKLTYAHEYTHALQDAAFGLDTLETDTVGEDDRSLARLSLIEGDATVTMLAWALGHLSQQELLEIGSGPIPDTADVPDWMMSQLLFPYLAGQEWILAIMAGSGGNMLAPDYGPVDDAFVDPPVSTAQILNAELWQNGVEPVEVELGDIAAGLGSGWEEVSASSVGQATTGIILEHLGVRDAAATVGWAGDRAVVVRGPDDEFALAWRTAWETGEDAVEFEDAYSAAAGGLSFPALVVRDGDTTLVVHASSEDLVRRTIEAAG